jgi:predicted TIM-barrel fold metal-dependent hydrolase
MSRDETPYLVSTCQQSAWSAGKKIPSPGKSSEGGFSEYPALFPEQRAVKEGRGYSRGRYHGESRRKFLQRVLGNAGVTFAATQAGQSLAFQVQQTPDWQPPESLIDTNVYIGQWPFRRLEYDQVDRLTAKLRKFGVLQAWVGNFEALLHRDIRAVNARLVQICRSQGENFLVPFPTVNPKLPDWQEDLREIVEVYRLPGIRLHPDYHGYTLDDADFTDLLIRAAQANLLVQLVLMMEDERSLHSALKVPTVDPKPLLEIIPKISGLKILLLNAQRVAPLPLLGELVKAGQVYVDIAWQEGVGGIGNLLSRVPAERVVFGSYFPQFYFLSGILKLRESAVTGEALTAIATENARRLLAA